MEADNSVFVTGSRHWGPFYWLWELPTTLLPFFPDTLSIYTLYTYYLFRKKVVKGSRS